MQQDRTRKWKPLILGTNKDEGTIFLPAISTQIPGNLSLPLTDAMTKVALEYFYNESTVVEILKHYQGATTLPVTVTLILLERVYDG
jgi:hypothetical protein